MAIGPGFRTMAAALLLVALPVAAQTVPLGKEGALARILPPVPNRKICFARSYDAAHLKRHPKQKVTALQFQIRYHRHDPSKENPEGQRNYYFDMAAKLRGYRKTLFASGECVPGEGTIHCGIDCDGGGVLVAHDDKTGVLTIRFADRHSHLRMSVGCGGEEGDTVDLTPGADDRIFRLDKAGPSACRRLNHNM